MESSNINESCFVPLCLSTKKKNPEKLFIRVPTDLKRRKQWFNLARRLDFSETSHFFCCEDHFSLKDDMENYMRYKMFGGYIKMKKDAVPHIFNCQADRPAAASKLPRPGYIKLNRKRDIQDILSFQANQENSNGNSHENDVSCFKKRKIFAQDFLNVQKLNEDYLNKSSDELKKCLKDNNVSESFNSSNTLYASTNNEINESSEINNQMQKNIFLKEIKNGSSNSSFLNEERFKKADVSVSVSNSTIYASNSSCSATCESSKLIQLPQKIFSFGEVGASDLVNQVKKNSIKKHFRSKGIMCIKKTKETQTQTDYRHTSNLVVKCCSPINILVEDYQKSSSTSTTNPSTYTSESDYHPSLNEMLEFEEEKISEQKRAALNMTNYFISIKPKNYIGIPKDWIWLVDELAKFTRLSADNIKLTLMKIKLNDSFIRLSDQFGLCRASASKIFNSSIPKIAHFLKTFVYCPDKKKCKKLLPISFRANFSNVFGIIDAFEIQIEKPSNAEEQSLTWSDYKGCNTLKYLLCITPDGFISFISKGYGGRISDIELFENCDFMNFLPEKSVIMTDRGFKNIDVILKKKSCELVRPPSVASSTKLTKEEVIFTKRVASLRIHVERSIRRIREFYLLKPHSTLNHNIMPMIDSIVVIVAALVNLQGPVIKT